MTEFQEVMETFQKLVPHGDESFMVLKAQLYAEHNVARYVAERVPSMVNEIVDRNSPVRSGLALILLAEALSLRDEVPPAHSDIIWPALKKLNSLRNDLAHNLYPNTTKIETRMREFVQIVMGQAVTPSENLNQSFYFSAMQVIAFLEIDRNPLLLSDCEE